MMMMMIKGIILLDNAYCFNFQTLKIYEIQAPIQKLCLKFFNLQYIVFVTKTNKPLEQLRKPQTKAHSQSHFVQCMLSGLLQLTDVLLVHKIIYNLPVSQPVQNSSSELNWLYTHPQTHLARLSQLVLLLICYACSPQLYYLLFTR